MIVIVAGSGLTASHRVSGRMGIGIAKRIARMGGALIAPLALLACAALPARAELLRVGKAVPEAFSFVPVDIGTRYGFFKKYGLEIETSSYSGGGMLTQALTAGSVDIGLGSSPEMA